MSEELSKACAAWLAAEQKRTEELTRWLEAEEARARLLDEAARLLERLSLRHNP